ncbi:Hypothetical_protein [Hexamita inflata]|uniref:Hypothetical_protein n=1 Tax=Hexamita inflata TaxID=28002 RepID=A0AA86U082_9EUKA|nr:Hypothetical protein HINF_LOCUS22831 [Hexamita inflata]
MRALVLKEYKADSLRGSFAVCIINPINSALKNITLSRMDTVDSSLVHEVTAQRYIWQYRIRMSLSGVQEIYFYNRNHVETSALIFTVIYQNLCITIQYHKCNDVQFGMNYFLNTFSNLYNQTSNFVLEICERQVFAVNEWVKLSILQTIFSNILVDGYSYSQGIRYIQVILCFTYNVGALHIRVQTSKCVRSSLNFYGLSFQMSRLI